MALAPDLSPRASELFVCALQGISAAPPHLHQYASAAWRFLDAAGYINFGLAADITAQRERKRSQLPRGSVIVIGAGLSGQQPCGADLRFRHTTCSACMHMGQVRYPREVADMRQA